MCNEPVCEQFTEDDCSDKDVKSKCPVMCNNCQKSGNGNFIKVLKLFLNDFVSSSYNKLC